jgi:hypothetical protein
MLCSIGPVPVRAKTEQPAMEAYQAHVPAAARQTVRAATAYTLVGDVEGDYPGRPR